MRFILLSIPIVVSILFSSVASAQARKYPPEFSDARAEVYKQVDDVGAEALGF